MKLKTFFIVSAVIFIIAISVSAQVSLPQPTATPRIIRNHFSYDHVPPVNVLENEEILVIVYVDNVYTGDEMRIHFREKSGSGFHTMPLGYNPVEKRFEVAIEERYHGNNSIEYYIEIFPQGLAPIRTPEEKGAYYTVKIKKRWSRYIEPLLIALLIASPAVGAYTFSKARKIHARKRAELERKLRSRRRQLGKEREKHYKDYLKTLSGGRKSTGNGTDHTQSRLPSSQKSEPNINKTIPRPATGRRSVAKSVPKEDTATDDALRKELDNILSRGADAETVLIPQNHTKPKTSVKKNKPTSKLHQPKAKNSNKSDDIGELNDDEKQKLIDLFDN